MPITFGTAYYPDHWPQTDWPRDLDRIAAAGITTIRFGELAWSYYEPRPGQFDWTNLDHFCDLLEKRGLKLCLATPTAAPPPWFDTLYPDGRLINMLGQKCLSHRHFWSWNHRPSLAHARKTITALALHYRDRPCLWGWQIDNEPGYAEEVHMTADQYWLRWYDFNPDARRDYVDWLRHRYNDSLDALNVAWSANFWSQRYSDWNELLPARGHTNPHAWLDFLRWRDQNIATQIHTQAAWLRELTPGKKIGVNIPEVGTVMSTAVGLDYFDQARELDWVGLDAYQATGDRAADLARHALSTDLIRAAAGPAQFYIAETQGGPHERSWCNPFAGETFGPDYLRQCAETYIAHGAQQIWWFLWRAFLGGTELGMNGVQALDGSNTERTALVRTLANEGKTKLPALRAVHLKKPLALIHYSRDSLRYRSFWPDHFATLDNDLTGWHAMLEAAGYRVEFLDDNALFSRDFTASAENARLLVLPFTMIASDTLVEKLISVSKNIHILAGPQTASVNEHGQQRPERIPEKLATAWAVEVGPWHDRGPSVPKLPGQPAITGYRQFAPRDKTKSAKISRPPLLSNRAPLFVHNPRATMFAVEVGDIWWRGTPAQRARITKAILKQQ